MSRNRVVAKAVAATAACTVILAGVLFYIVYKFIVSRQQRKRSKLEEGSSFRRETTPVVMIQDEFREQGGTLKGLIVDENGKDVLYLRKSQASCFSKVWFNPINDEEEEEKIMDYRGEKPSISSPIQEIPLLHQQCHVSNFQGVEKNVPMIMNPGPGTSANSKHAIPLPPPTPLVIPTQKTPPPPPPPPMKMGPVLPPPPPPKFTGTSSSGKPPAVPRGKAKKEALIKENSSDKGEIRTRLKPLHWDKVATNVEHSVVWNEINDGSFRFDDELIEALFGYTTSNQKSTEVRNNSRTFSPTVPAQIFILDPRKSQNTAIVLKSLAVSRKEILDSIVEGHGLSADVLEKLARISPTDEEAAKILQFDGNPKNLADAELFLYHILKSIPSAFIRIKAMLFRSCYDPEILQLKESLQTLELSCKELRSRGIFLKLLEAILKAGNRMNAGTSRGNAQGFNLSALRKLSSVRSTDGKTTLLHFVVEQVTRSEGKRRASKDDEQYSDNKAIEEERDCELLSLGLPVLGSLSTEFSNVKKAATIDYENFIKMSNCLTSRVNDIRELVIRCGSSEISGFVREMKAFLEECEEELKVVSEEQTRVIELVKRTTEYYQAGASKGRGTDAFQLFAIVKDFLDMVDKVCTEISRKLQKKNVTSATSSPPLSSPRTPVRFQNLQTYFQSEKSGTISSDSENDF